MKMKVFGVKIAVFREGEAEKTKIKAHDAKETENFLKWKLEFVWKHKSYLDSQTKIMALLIFL